MHPFGNDNLDKLLSEDLTLKNTARIFDASKTETLSAKSFSAIMTFVNVNEQITENEYLNTVELLSPKLWKQNKKVKE